MQMDQSWRGFLDFSFFVIISCGKRHKKIYQNIIEYAIFIEFFEFNLDARQSKRFLHS